MKAIVFAGGIGTRLWPLSRRHSPKQFERVIGEKSTLQLSVERLLTNFSWEDIFIATSVSYTSLVKEQLPHIPEENIIGEPETRDVGPAVGLVTAYFLKKYANEPIVILWSDHIIRENELFHQILKTCNDLVIHNKNKIIFISQKPRFASQNLGWIKYGSIKFQRNGINFYKFDNFHYRPDLTTAQKYFKSGYYSWNVGYFVTTPAFLWYLFEQYQPGMFITLKEINRIIGSRNFKTSLKKLYPILAKVSFDNAILERISKEDALVVCENLGWSDVGAWEALKEALQSSPDQNVIQGKVLLTDCRDSLVYNYTNQMVVTIDLEGFLVINTHDVILVCHKHSVPKIKKLVENLAKSENEHLV